jgi:hypothetical protein
VASYDYHQEHLEKLLAGLQEHEIGGEPAGANT